MTPIITPDQAVALALVFTRVIAVLMAFPFINTAMLPRNVKILLVVSLAFFAVQNLDIHLQLQNLGVWDFIFLIFKELLVGFALGLLANFFISAFSYAAEIISYFMGITVVNIFDPTYGQVSVLSKFFIMLFYMIFFVSGAYEYFVATLFASFEHYPLTMQHLHSGFWHYVIQNSITIFTLAFKLAFPFALILYLINVALALVNRLIPQINVFIVGLPLQIFVGIAALAAGASIIVYLGVSYLQNLNADILYFIKHIGN
ncbi:flagellar biosynthetic protein FliR [Nitratiruptor sp. YY09-18]|uniref:flagellar biosynthetic protein FliR n=1 Tax=Nitratiruptor sp. YY09-18 TaxID=2724901 RepID=UPI0019157A8F|nr:flagellar biosynthetic protein FliR [Nitratiruptor sp. YY09-18]BCD68376.1 flagellar biosynthetic protein FliR [Nitratiruptor sp. YY09-18]